MEYKLGEISKRQYIEKLEKMLDKVLNEGYHLGFVCPGKSNFLLGEGDTGIDSRFCEWCHKLFGSNSCPCRNLGQEKALETAQKEIKKFKEEENDRVLRASNKNQEGLPKKTIA